jgi:hypothetical protein
MCLPTGTPKPTTNPAATPRASNQGGCFDNVSGATKFLCNTRGTRFHSGPSGCFLGAGSRKSVVVLGLLMTWASSGVEEPNSNRQLLSIGIMGHAYHLGGLPDLGRSLARSDP